MHRAARLCPAAAISSTSAPPDLSSASWRVSETVRTAMLTARNGRDSSSRGMADHFVWWRVESDINRPVTGRKHVEIRRRLAKAHAIDPIVGKDALDENTGLAR